MKRLLKVVTYIAIFTLLIPMFPAQMFANEGGSNLEADTERVLLMTEEPDQDILLYHPLGEPRIIATLNDMSIGLLVSEQEHQSLVSIDFESIILSDEEFDLASLYNSENDSYEFLVDNIHITKESEAEVDFDEILNEYLDSKDHLDTEVDINDTEIDESDDKDSDEEDNSDIEDQEYTDDDLSNETVIEDNQEEGTNQNEDETEKTTDDIPSVESENPSEEIVNLEEEEDQEKKQRKAQEKNISIATFSARSTVDFSSLKSVEAIALQQNTKVYASTTTNANVLKTYSQGQLLKLRKYSNSWYAARVFINGKAQWGYISHADADEVIAEKRINGQSNVQSAKVYTSPSRNSSVLKDYSKGKLVIYRTYTSQWHTAQVYINGKPVKGYIHADDVIPQPTYKAIAALEQVAVYQKASKSSKKLKSYKQGHIITYRKYNSTWHYATVYINGKPTSGYIYAKDLDNLTSSQASLQKYGLKSPTKVYSATSRNSSTLKSYKQGHLLKFHTYSESWYRTTVYINGKANTGYIHVDDVADVKPTSVKKYNGLAIKSNTNVYASNSTSSNILKSYNLGSFLKFSSYSDDWYEATVFIKGKSQIGYIHKDDVIITNDKTIVLDAGHGGYDPGASGNGLQEKILTLEITKNVQSLLLAKGYKVIMTRSDDRYLELKQRTDLANNRNADIMVSIHINSGGGTGIETWKMNAGPNPSKSTILATSLQEGMINTTKVNNRGVKDGNLYINRESKMPSSLVEIGFIDHPLDSVLLKQNAFKQNAAQGIANGIDSYFIIYK